METRPIKELLIILRDNLEDYLKRYNYGGMCPVIWRLLKNDVINDWEENILQGFLEHNKPRNAYIRRKKEFPTHFDDAGFALPLHWWTPRAVPPRMRWLNQQIDKL